ncbi:MAG: InlB B-repeat-containing protein [Roseburia sp.]|nr:InlB B-repeat-containing protein [Roseburia sp.]
MRKAVTAFLTLAAAVFCAAGFAACSSSESGNGYKTFNITYHLNGGEMRQGQYYNVNDDGTVSREIYYDKESTGTVNQIDVERDTWILDGWYLDGDFQEKFTVFDTNGQEDIDLYAKWTDKITVTRENFKDYFKISSGWNGGLNVGNAAVKYSFEPKYTLDPSKCTVEISVSATPHLGSWTGSEREITLTADNDYSFSASAKVTDATEFILGEATLNYTVDIPEPVELYLLHKDPITVTLDTDGGTVETPQFSVAGGDTLKSADLPEPVREGYKFMGWYADGEFKKEFDKISVTRPVTVYAKWERQTTYTFDTRGGSEKQPVVFRSGAYIYLNGKLNFGDDPVKENFGFFGWYLDEECTQAFDETVADESRTLYARWEPYRTVTFNTHGGSEKEAMQILNTSVLTEQTLGAEPEKSGLVFNGWYYDGEYKEKYGGEPVTGDIVLHARWCYEYNGFSYQTDEKMAHFFDVECPFERTEKVVDSLVKRDLVVHIGLKLKDEFLNCDFIVQFNVDVKFYNEDGTFLGNDLVDVWVSTSSGKTDVSTDMVKNSMSYSGIYADTAEVRLSFYCRWSSVLLPESYVAP